MLLVKCSLYTADKYQYKNFTRLSDISDVSPDGYILRLPIYVQGRRDSLIKLSARKNPAPNADVYEIGMLSQSAIQTNAKKRDEIDYFIFAALGENANKNVIIRRKQGYQDLVKVEVGDVLAEDQPTKFVIEITNSKNKIIAGFVAVNSNNQFHILGGDIRVFSELNPSKALASVHDDRVIRVKYMSFAIYEPSKTEFFYNCDF